MSDAIFARALANLVGQRVERVRRQIAQLDRQPDDAWNHVRRVRLHVEMTDGADLPARARRHDLAHRERQMRRRDQRILPLRHRRRARMIREAGDHRAIALNRDDAFDDADGGGAAFERAALLDVQLEIAVMRALRPHRVLDALGAAADPADGFGARHAVPGLIEIARRDVARRDPAAGEAAAERDAFLGGPDDDLERMTRADVRARAALR